MESEASGLRARLNSLSRTVTRDPQTQEILSSNGDVPSEFLKKKNGISLISHEFDKTGDSAAKNLNLDPPLLFAHCPQQFFQQYPLDPDALPNPKWAKPIFKYPKFKEASLVATRVSSLSRYLYRWAGGGMPRKVRVPGFIGIRDLRGVVGVGERHALHAGLPFRSHIAHQYMTDVLEYDSERIRGNKPHVMLLGEIPDIGQDGSILYGELALLLTAMRNRAYQPAVFKYPDSGDESERKEDAPVARGFLFEDERRFPVIMVSVIGIQHARISYACMEVSKVVIRHSQTWSLENKDEVLLNFLAGILLSEPLDEAPVVELTH